MCLPADTGRRRTPSPGRHCPDAALLEKDRAPCAGITQIRFEGLWAVAHTLSAVRSPVGLLMFLRTLTPNRPGEKRGSRHMQQVEARGLTFDVYEGGRSGGPAVLLLHGFPQDHREFELIAPR